MKPTCMIDGCLRIQYGEAFPATFVRMAVMRLAFTLLFLSAVSFAQLPSSRCDSRQTPLAECSFVTGGAGGSAADADDSDSETATSPDATHQPLDLRMNLLETSAPRKPGFRWGRALFESFMFFSIEQAYVVKDDYKWVISENGVPFNHYWRDYKHSLHSWINSGWNDGDPALYSYLGHPLQGAMTSYIYIQNDPRGQSLEFSNTREYWHSRLRAAIWSAVYSTQWNIGPLSELTFEKYGTLIRGSWNQDGTWPCHSQHHCYNGVGQVDLVTTPIGGFGWQVMEDVVDKDIIKRVEANTSNRFLINVTRCALNPIRGGANILHGKSPWFRVSRDIIK